MTAHAAGTAQGLSAVATRGFSMIHLSIRTLAAEIHNDVEKLVDNRVGNFPKSPIVSALYRFA